MPPKQVASLWRQWERFTVSGVRVNNKRYTAAEALFAWFILLVSLYLLRMFMSSNPQDAVDLANRFALATDPDFWEGRHLIFTVSPGRAGSKHLRDVFNVADDTIARHEPEPKMNDDVLQHVLLEGRRAETVARRAASKLGAIRDELEGTAPHVVYAETSHMFVKTYSDVVLQYLANVANISVVILHRPLRDVVWSQLRLGWFSPKHSGRDIWYYDVADLHESERMVSLSSNFTAAVDKLIAYNADVRQRAVELRRQIRTQQAKGEWKNVQVIDVQLADLSSTSGVSSFLSRLKLHEDKHRLQLLSEQDSNARTEKKDRVHTDVTLSTVDSRLDHFANKLPMLQASS